MQPIPEITSLDAIRRENPDMLVMYSSWSGGFIKNPALMMVPLDDHLVHRGDGIFEAMKVIGSKIYLRDKHLRRLANSAEGLGFDLSKLPQMGQVLDEICEKHQDLGTRLLRIFVSRGPGSFTTNPYDCKAPQLYVILQKFKPVAASSYEKGVKIGKSQWAPKGYPWATIKSCNYLLNVMMKKEAVDRGLDFVIGFDGDTLTESSTENLLVLTTTNELIVPPKETILAGTTLARLLELISQKKSGFTISQRKLTIKEIEAAKEVFMVGTTLDALPVTSWEGKPIGSGSVGVLAKEFKALLEEDQLALK